MPSTFIREYLLHLVFGVTLLVLLSVIYKSPQAADPSFNTNVSRPAYTNARPRVLFDEAHRNFHTTGGRYKPFAELLAKDGYQITPNTQEFKRETLLDHDILVISNAQGANETGDSSAFSETECAAIREWVAAGGSLLLVTDIYPMGVASEMLARHFGVEMSKGKTEDCENSAAGAEDPSVLVFTRERNLLTAHPITDGREQAEQVNRVITYSGQSLKGPEGSVPFLRLADTAADRVLQPVEVEGGDYQPSRVLRYGEPISAAGRAQGLAFNYGKGRVVVLGEASVLSAQIRSANNSRFGMNDPRSDNKQLTLNIMHWLSRLI